MTTSRELVEQARGGDRDAFGQLVPEAVTRLRGLAYKILRDADAADEAVQQALVLAWRRLPTLRDADRFEAWTYRLTVRACTEIARRERARRMPLRLLRDDDLWEADDAALIADRDALGTAFEGLSVHHRSVIVLHYYVGMSLIEVAEVLGIPHGTVRSRMHYGLATLRRLLSDGAVEGWRAG